MSEAFATSLTVRVIAWALFESVWQGAVICGATAAVLLVLRRRSPQVRYALACVGLAAMLAMPVLTVVGRMDSLLVGEGYTPARPSVVSTVTQIMPNLAPSALVSSVASGVGVRDAAAPEQVSHWPAIAVLLWTTGVFVCSLRFLRSWIIVERIRRAGTRPAPDAWRLRAQTMAVRLRMSRPIQLLESTFIDGPMVIGWIRPVVLIPASAFTGLSSAQLEAVIAHELAHIRRHDYLVNVVQTAAETLLFYHPATWWLSRQIRLEREHCCDDVAVTQCTDRTAYVRALADLEGLRQMRPSLGLGATSGPLERRVRRILGVPSPDQHRAAYWVGLWLVLAVVAFALQNVHARGAGPRSQAASQPQAATQPGHVRGQVVEALSGRPLAGASISVTRFGEVRSAKSDVNGRYEVRNLSPGEYHVYVRAEHHVPAVYGQRSASEAGAPVEIQSGRITSGIDIRVQRAAVVNGRIFDASGEGFPGVEIELLTERYLPRVPSRVPVAFARTEDFGAFRVGDLPPGQYYLRAYAPDGTRSARIGTKVYAATYLPGTTKVEEAQPILISPGQELFGIDLALATVDTVSVTGTLIDPEGYPFDHTSVVLMGNKISRGAKAVSVSRDGMFRISDVIPGQYFLRVDEPGCPPSNADCRAAALRAGAGRWLGVFEEVTIEGDLSGLRLVARRGAHVEGRIVSDGPPLTFDPRTLRVGSVRHIGARPNVTEAMTMTSGQAVASDGTFAIDHVLGRSTLDVSGLPDGWKVKTVRLNGTDLTEQPTDFGEGTRRQVEVVLTNQISELFGRVTDSRGQAVSNYIVVVFPADRDRWMFPSRSVQAARSRNDGSYQIQGLPSGSYLTTALLSLPMNAWNDPHVIELLENGATQFRVGEGEQRALNLRLSATPDGLRAW